MQIALLWQLFMPVIHSLVSIKWSYKGAYSKVRLFQVLHFKAIENHSNFTYNLIKTNCLKTWTNQQKWHTHPHKWIHFLETPYCKNSCMNQSYYYMLHCCDMCCFLHYIHRYLRKIVRKVLCGKYIKKIGLSTELSIERSLRKASSESSPYLFN